MEKSIEERADEYNPLLGTDDGMKRICDYEFDHLKDAYITGATEQKAIDDELCKSGEASDGYHTFNELYDFRREYNAALVNSGVWKAHKSHRHHSGELCFGGGWFIVMIDTPYGQISNHYQDKYWEEFNCEEKEVADEWDGHTEKDVLNRLRACNTDHCRKNGGIDMTKSILDVAVELREIRAEERANSKYTPKKFGCEMSDNDVVLHNIQMEAKRVGYIEGAKEQKELDDKRIAELEKEKASLVLEIHNKNKRIAELIAK